MEHFPFCHTVRALLADSRLPTPLVGWELDTLLGLQELPAVDGLDSVTLCGRFAVARYGLYRLHGALRHGTVGPAHIPGAFQELCRQGASATLPCD